PHRRGGDLLFLLGAGLCRCLDHRDYQVDTAAGCAADADGWGRAVHAALAGAADPFDGGHLSVGRRGRTSRALWLVPALYVAAALRAATGADPMVAVGLRCAHRHPLYYSADDAGDRRL